MKKTSLDIAFLVIFLAWLGDLDFNNLTTLKYIGLCTVSIWFIMFIKKLFTKAIQ